MSGISVDELCRRFVREEALQKLLEDKSKMDIGSSGELQVGRAKTPTQLKRNSSFTKAIDLLKKDSRCQGKDVEICWKVGGSKERQEQKDGQVAFQQILTDLAGHFLPPFENVSF